MILFFLPHKASRWPLAPAKPWTWGPQHRRAPGAPRRRVLRDVLVAGVCFALVFCIFSWRPFGRPDPTDHPLVGTSAGFVEVVPLDRAKFAIQSGGDPQAILGELLTVEKLAGCVGLVVFWGPWMEPSVTAVEQLARVLPVVSRKDFRFIAVACPPPAEFDTGEDFLTWTETTWAGLQVPTTCYLDPGGASQARLTMLLRSTSELPVRGMVLPTTLLVDGHGTIRAVWIGWLPGQEKQVYEEVSRLLDQGPLGPNPLTRRSR